MPRVLITGSTDGLGLMAAKRLADQGHEVTTHARNEARAADARKALPAAEKVLVKAADVRPAAQDPRLQDELLGYCASLTGVDLPPGP